MIFRFTNVVTAVTNMGNKDLDKKQLKISSSAGTNTDSIEAAQDDDCIKMTLTEYQSLILGSKPSKIILNFDKNEFLAWKLDWMKFKWIYKP